ncbi:MAG: methyltetrahydrofolate cobalamin methyltransferase [Planctomycetota bacterium]|jgi:5-methyltetrahydrofolate--homocysteine methyltransferase
MLVIGEKINSTRKKVKKAIATKDKAFLQKLAIDQTNAGADYLDVNTGAFPSQEVELMKWLIHVVQEVVETPLAIDSSSPDVLETGLKLHRNGTPMINSITLEKARFEKVLPLIFEHNANVLALSIGDEGIAGTIEERFETAKRLVDALCAEGVEQNCIYLDPLIQPISVQNDFGLIALGVIRRIKQEFPQINTICGLSNISFGLPQRAKLNRVFLIMAMAAGLDSAILDPLDHKLMNVIRTSEALLGKDRYCKNYIKVFREKICND